MTSLGRLVRSHQRDSDHVSRLGELVTDVARNFRGEYPSKRVCGGTDLLNQRIVVGSQWVLARGETLQVLTKLLYFGLTFASGAFSSCPSFSDG